MRFSFKPALVRISLCQPIRHLELTVRVPHHPLIPCTFPVRPQYSGYHTKFSRRFSQIFIHGRQRIIESCITWHGPT